MATTSANRRRRAVTIDEIELGTPLKGDLVDEAGEVLFAAGRKLDKFDLVILQARPEGRIFLTEDQPAQGAASTRNGPAQDRSGPGAKPSDDGPIRKVSASSLRAGMTLTQSLYDLNGVLLLAAGCKVTERFLVLLRERSISVLEMRGAGAIRRIRSRAPNKALAKTFSKTGRPLGIADLVAEAQQGLEQYIAASELAAEMSSALKLGRHLDGDRMREVITSFVDRLILDRDLLLTVIGMKRTEGEYLFDHGMNVALLSMAIGAQHGLTPDQVVELGSGAVFQDVGMLELGEDVRLAPRAFTTDERERLRNHPAHTLSYLQRVSGLSDLARFICYQVHERADGSGYPRGRSNMTTHLYARIVGVADVYCAMTRPRPHRPPIMPHGAIKQILTEGHAGKFDRQVLRSFLDCVSVFPIGSIVELSDGRPVRVIRPNAGAHTRPVVAEIDSEDNPAGDPIDLSQSSGLKIVRELRYVQS